MKIANKTLKSVDKGIYNITLSELNLEKIIYAVSILNDVNDDIESKHFDSCEEATNWFNKKIKEI